MIKIIVENENWRKMFIQLSIGDCKSLDVEVHYQNSTTNSYPKTFYNKLKHPKRLQNFEMYQNVNN
jgi:hypothetical protein